MIHRRLGLLAALLISLAACNSKPAPVQRYPLTGRIVSIDVSTSSISVDGDAISNFMPAMTMSYKVKNAAEIEPLTPSASITATIVKQQDDYWLEDVHIAPPVKPAPTPAKPALK